MDETPNQLGKDIIALRDREKGRQGNFRSLWQSVADLEFPQTYGITSMVSAGTELMSGLFDTTAVEEAENMASGIANNLFPAGQMFFALLGERDLAENTEAKRYLQYLGETTHRFMFDSNFMAQVNNTIKYWLVFGTGAIYCDWTPRDGLNYRDYAIGTYQCLENSRGVVDTIILTCPMTARQIVQQFGEGEERVGKSVWTAYFKPERKEDSFDVIHVIRPRKDYDPNPVLRRATRDPFESLYVQEKDSFLLQEGGYGTFPFCVPRYEVIYGEVYGRGRGVMLLPQVRQLNRRKKDFDEMSNKWVNPPKVVHDSFEGLVDVTPGALNYVTQMDAIQPINMGANGVFPVTKDLLEYYREEIRQGFFKNAFEALTPLSGDRRTTTEIIERLKEGMKKLNKPMSRLFTELVGPLVERTIRVLMDNGQVDRPPWNLQGRDYKIEFINPLALALRDQQSRGLQYWLVALGQMEALFPGVKDNADHDKAARDLGESLGVKTEHIRPIRDRDQIRAERQQIIEQQRMAELAKTAAEGYGKTTKTPEPGSLAGALIGE